MRSVLLALAAVVSLNGMAIEFITEAQVATAIGAQKVIEVNKYNVKTLLQQGTPCESDTYSKSARAYVVKKGDKVQLYVTPSGLSGLKACIDL